MFTLKDHIKNKCQMARYTKQFTPTGENFVTLYLTRTEPFIPTNKIHSNYNFTTECKTIYLRRKDNGTFKLKRIGQKGI